LWTTPKQPCQDYQKKKIQNATLQKGGDPNLSISCLFSWKSKTRHFEPLFN